MAFQDKPGTSKQQVKVIMRHPVNLLFMKWVTEWRDEANQKKQQSALSYNRALKSLQKYPLALTSGKETKLLQNVGEKTAKMLDERLNEWKREFGEPTLELVDPDLPLNKMSKKKSPKKSEDDGNLNKSPLKLPPGSYVPAYRSGSYALLLTLYKNQIDTLGTSFLSKVDLQIKAQALCDKSFTVPEKNCYYTAWSSMATLIEKNLVEKKKSPAQYSLTPAGFELAVSLENIRETTNVAVDINDLSPIKTSPAKKRKSEDKEKAAVSKASEVPTKKKKVAETFTKVCVPPNNEMGPSDDYELPTESTFTCESNVRLPTVVSSSAIATPKTFKFTYVTADNEETIDIDRAEVRIDDITCDVSYKIRTKRSDLEMCGRLYRIETQEANGFVTAFLQDDSVPMAPGYDKATNEPQKTSMQKTVITPVEKINRWEKKVSSVSVESDSSANDIPISSQPDEQRFSLYPGRYEIVLCVDNGELTFATGKGGHSGLIKTLLSNGVVFDQRKLSVGDFLWIVRERIGHRPDQLQLPQAKELVLDFIIERKRLDDLAASIMDSRFREQKHRLKRCGLKNVTYLFENCGNAKNQSIPYSTLQQAVVNTQVQDGFNVKWTQDAKDTVGYLTLMTRYLQSSFNQKTFHSCTKAELISARDLQKGSIPDSTEVSLMTFEEFNRTSVKTRPMSARELFARQLLQFHGLTVEKAVVITEVYPTMTQLLAAYEKCKSVGEKENLLAKFKGQMANRNVGPQLSKTVYQFFATAQRFTS